MGEPAAATAHAAGSVPPAAARPTPASARMPRAEAAYAFCAAAFCVVLVLTNIIGVKLFSLWPEGRPAWLPGAGPLTLTSGIVAYPFTFLLTDVVSEIWGRRRADYMVKLGFWMSFLMLGLVQIAKWLPPSTLWPAPPDIDLAGASMQAVFEASFYYPGLLLFASMLAYLAAQLLDVRLYHFWWRVSGGRHLWLRNNGSTLISQLVDTLIVNGIFLRWGLGLEWGVVGSIIVAVYACKVVLALLDTPLIYAARWWLRRHLGLPADPAPGRAPLEDAAPA